MKNSSNTTTREQAISFLKGACPIRMRASKAPAEFRDLVTAIHKAYWNDEGDVVCEPRAAIHHALATLFPNTTTTLPQRKGSEGCARCSGTGYIAAFSHIHNGRCVACW